MPVVFQKWISRKDLIDNPDKWYVFGDNVARIDLGGQSKEMRGQPNAIGVAVKNYPGYEVADYWYDKHYDRNVQYLDLDFKKITKRLKVGAIVVFPLAGIGTNRALLADNAPRTLEYINNTINRLRVKYSEPASKG